MATSDQTLRPTASRNRPQSGSDRGSFLLGLAVLGAMALRNRLGPSGESGQPRPTRRSGAIAVREARQPAERGRRHEADGAAADARGHEAGTPTAIPAGGWKDILTRVYQQVQEDRVMLIAAGVTYYGLLALFPALAALVSLFGLVADPASIQQQLSNLEGVVPEGALQIIGNQISRIQAQGGGTLGLYFFIKVNI